MGKAIISGGAVMVAPVRGTPISDVAVGSVVSLNVGGTPTEFIVVHQGLPSSDYDSSCDGMWLLQKVASPSKAFSSVATSERYDVSLAHSYLNSTFSATNYELAPDEGAKLAYFESGVGSSAKTKRIAVCGNGQNGIWWTRTPSLDGKQAIVVKADGSCNSISNVSSCYYRPAFILPKTALITKDGKVVV